MKTNPSQPSAIKPRLMVVSPFIDKSHGTERVVAEQIERLSKECEIRLYSERLEDLGPRTNRLASSPYSSRTASLPISGGLSRKEVSRDGSSHSPSVLNT
jgi:hypothetical protein